MDYLNNKRIFVLDHSMAFRESLRIMLENYSASVESCAASDEAIMKIIRWHPHLLITGVEVGKINGYDLCLILKLMPDYASMPVILISSGDTDLTMRKASEAGADYYFRKDKKLVSNIATLLFQEIFIPQSSGRTSRKKHIENVLVVDDSRVMRQVIKNILTGAGIKKVFEAAHGLEALETLRSHRPDLVLSDWNMPRMNGLEFLKELRKNSDYDNIPVIMVTTESGKNNIKQAAEAGANGHLSKPFNAKNFTDMLAGFATNIKN